MRDPNDLRRAAAEGCAESRLLITRRAMLGVTAGLFSAAYLPRDAMAADGDARLLVVVLRGGTDGLSVVVPTGDRDYERLRRDIVFPEGFVTAALSVLHEPLGGLAALEWGLDARSAQVIATHHRWGDHPADEPLSQVVFLAEAVDIVRQRQEDVDLDGLWLAGDLDGSMDAVSLWLKEDIQALEEEERAHKRRVALAG